MFHIVVLGEPTAQARARYSAIHGYVRAYDPRKSYEYKRAIIQIAKQYQGKPMEGPLVMKVDIYRGVPKSWSEKKRQQALNGLIKPIMKPDCSNYLKGIEDALNGIAYLDDSQIVLVIVSKQYDKEPRAEIRVWEDTDENNEKYYNESREG